MYMNSITKNRLIDSGWKEQRRINTDMIRKKYSKNFIFWLDSISFF